MKKIAVFPGSFDPFTLGHESVVRRAIPLFDQIIVAIGINSSKHFFFSISKRRELIDRLFKNEPIVVTDTFESLTVDYCLKVGANFILRGLRTSADFEYERAIAQSNKALFPGIESVFLLTMPEHSFITSSLVRDILVRGGNADLFLPEGFLH
jgi:pantetheine-phosphate adenylyltransferase